MTSSFKDPGEVPANQSPLGSDQAFSKFFEESFEATVAWTLKNFKDIIRGRARAEDAVMDAFDALYRERMSLEDRDPLPCLQRRVRALLIDQSRNEDAAANYRRDGASKKSPDALARPADSILASRECRELFSEEAVGSLPAQERLIYDLYLQEKTYQEMADVLGVSKEAARWQLRQVIFKLFQAMARLTTLSSPQQFSIPDDALVLRTPEHARRAVENNLPRLLSQAVRLVHLEKVPHAKVVTQLRLGSQGELAMHLKRAYQVLELIYKAKMPDALISALAYQDPRKKRLE